MQSVQPPSFWPADVTTSERNASAIEIILVDGQTRFVSAEITTFIQLIDGFCNDFQAGTEDRKVSVLEAKRGVIARAEEEFTAQMFQLTTDEDMPTYTAFDFV